MVEFNGIWEVWEDPENNSFGCFPAQVRHLHLGSMSRSARLLRTFTAWSANEAGRKHNELMGWTAKCW